MPRRIPLRESGQVTLNASGGGTVELKPSYTGQTWYVTLAAVNVQPRPSTLEPECALYVNGAFVGGTYTGSLDSTDLKEILQTNQSIKAIWTGGDAGATAYLTLTGEQELAGG